jgi:hypothetical protein
VQLTFEAENLAAIPAPQAAPAPGAHLAVAHGGELVGDGGADAVVGLEHGGAQQLGEAGDNGGQAELVLGALLGAAQVGGQQHLGAVVDQVLEGGHRGANAGVVADGAVGQGDLQQGGGVVGGIEGRWVGCLFEGCFRECWEGGMGGQRAGTVDKGASCALRAQPAACAALQLTLRSARTNTTLPSRSALVRSPTAGQQVNRSKVSCAADSAAR